ncbi:MAG: GntR family transcriptional regulator [Rhizobiaceae bacterium]|nr:GntR family transcriptional regulator [Rhizobiaceae bacterium]
MPSKIVTSEKNADIDGSAPGKRHPANAGTASFLYRSIRDLLAEKIETQRFPPGTILKEGSIAVQLGVSRAPVRRALTMLYDEGAIRAADGQGYIVGTATPVPMSTRRLHEILVSQSDDIGRSATWERIYAEVSNVVMSSMPFGTYRIQEEELGHYHQVSRTVAREVLWRLMDRRLIEKNRKSHWIIGQMTASDIRETLEMRQLLEPRALGHVAHSLDHEWLGQLATRIAEAIEAFPEGGKAALEDIEADMFTTMYARLRNARMLSSIERNQISLIVPRLFRQHFPIRDDLPAMKEYAQIVHHLRTGSVEVAQVLLTNHIVRIEQLTLARLRVLSELSPPQSAPYLIAIH